jgi:hypothetical protein
MARLKLKYKAANLLRLERTVDETDNTAIDDAAGGTARVQLFDDRKDTELSADEATSQTILSVNHTRGAGHEFAVDDELHIELDDGTYDTLAITAIDHAAKTLTVETGLTSSAASGAALSVLLGSTLTMSEFGTPSIDPVTYDWGYEVTMPANHPGIERGQDVRIQYELLVSGTVQLRERLVATVEGAA